MTPVLLGTGKDPRNEWFYITENELSPGATRCGNYDTGPLELSKCQRFQWVRDQLQKDGVNIASPTGNQPRFGRHRFDGARLTGG